MGIDQELAKSAIRISLGWNSTLAETKRFLEVWQKNYLKQKLNVAA